MVLGLLTIAAIPTTIGVCEGVAQQREQNRQDAQDSSESRLDKFHVNVYCDARSNRAKEVHGRQLVLKNGKVYIASRARGSSGNGSRGGSVDSSQASRSTSASTSTLSKKRNKDTGALAVRQPQGQGQGQGHQQDETSLAQQPTVDNLSQAHPVTAFYITYPDEERPPPRPRGLVSTISVDPPMLNWLYVDKDTYELKYGNRSQSREHIVGPWDWTEDEVGLTLEGWEGFVAVEEVVNVPKGGSDTADTECERESVWAIYYDRKDDRLRSLGGTRKKILEISLERKMLEEEKQGREDK